MFFRPMRDWPAVSRADPALKRWATFLREPSVKTLGYFLRCGAREARDRHCQFFLRSTLSIEKCSLVIEGRFG
jgi:hypothetical protein